MLEKLRKHFDLDNKVCMTLNFRMLNESRTEIVIFGLHGGCSIAGKDVSPLDLFLKLTVKNLGNG